MKMKTLDQIYYLPVTSGLHLIYEFDNRKELLNCLISYFGQKKKTKCVVLDDEDHLISPKEAELIYFPKRELSTVFDFKPKTELNNELTVFISENQEKYMAIEKIRDDLKDLLTDHGMYRYRKILSDGTDMNLKMDTSNFNVSTILQNLRIDADLLSEQEQMITLYNLYRYIHRKQFCIIYIDFAVDLSTLDWLKNISNPNTLILVENESVHANYAKEFDSLIAVKASEPVEEIELSVEYAESISYLFHPVVLRYPVYQNEKILDLMTLFRDFDSTFLIKFQAYNSAETL